MTYNVFSGTLNPAQSIYPVTSQAHYDLAFYEINPKPSPFITEF